MKQSGLYQFTLDIEFLLISVVQGVALAALAGVAIKPITELQVEFWPYILAGFLLILAFWSQAIVHALSFISWPLDLSHNFLYFLAGFVEVVAFSQITNPLGWFVFMFLFVVVAAALYIIDLKLIRDRAHTFRTKAEIVLYKHILEEQVKELKYLIPLGLMYNFLMVYLLWNYPDLFIVQKHHLWLVFVQLIFNLGLMIISVKSFNKRSKLITNAVKRD